MRITYAFFISEKLQSETNINIKYLFF